MKSLPECVPCCLRRVLHTAERNTTDEWLHRKILAEAMKDLSRVDELATPAELIFDVSKRAKKTLGLPDPYHDEKRRWIADTTTNAEWIRSVVDAADDPFLAALRLSGAANVLDCELRQDFVKRLSLKSLVNNYERLSFALDNVEDFRLSVANAKKVLFIHDAAGELFFDRLLIEKMEKPPEAVFSVVREEAVLADATAADAAAVGLEEVAQIVSPGIDCLGLPLNACSQTFRSTFSEADVVLAKGQACYQTLEADDSQGRDKTREVYFLLRVKCNVMARRLGVSVGDITLEVV